MFFQSSVILAAGLLGTVAAQNLTSTITQDVYQATTTISADCSVCTTNAVVSAYTVVVSAGVTTTIGSAASVATSTSTSDNGSGTNAADTVASNTGSDTNAASAVAASWASSATGSCGFQLAVNGTTTLEQISDGQIQVHTSTLGQISDGQIQSDSNLTASTFTLSGGMIYDQAGRTCSISGQNQSQFQCNYVPTTGSTEVVFSLIGSDLAFNGDTTFYACLLGGEGDGYNIYQTLTGVQSSCSPITLQAINSAACASSVASVASVTSVAQPTVISATAVAGTVPASAPAVAYSTASSSIAASSAAMPVVTALPTASANGGSSLSPKSVTGLLVAAAFSLMML